MMTDPRPQKPFFDMRVKPFPVAAIIVLLFGVCVLLIARYTYLEHLDTLSLLMGSIRDRLGWKTVIIAGIAYAILLSVPFFPGVELAWLVILLFGRQAAPVFYVFTILGLCWSFFVGRWLERSWLTSRFDLNVLKAGFSNRTERVRRKLILLVPDWIRSRTPAHIVDQSRYIILAILVNLPGNSIIGGGGGIAFLCGTNRSFSWKGFVITIALAVSPVPVFIMTGLISLESVAAIFKLP